MVIIRKQKSLHMYLPTYIPNLPSRKLMTKWMEDRMTKCLVPRSDFWLDGVRVYVYVDVRVTMGTRMCIRVREGCR